MDKSELEGSFPSMSASEISCGDMFLVPVAGMRLSLGTIWGKPATGNLRADASAAFSCTGLWLWRNSASASQKRRGVRSGLIGCRKSGVSDNSLDGGDSLADDSRVNCDHPRAERFGGDQRRGLLSFGEHGFEPSLAESGGLVGK